MDKNVPPAQVSGKIRNMPIRQRKMGKKGQKLIKIKCPIFTRNLARRRNQCQTG